MGSISFALHAQIGQSRRIESDERFKNYLPTRRRVALQPGVDFYFWYWESSSRGKVCPLIEPITSL